MYFATLLLAATVTICAAMSEIISEDKSLKELHRVGRSMLNVAGATMEAYASPALPCHGEGIFTHPVYCNKFYRCIDVFSNKDYMRLAFKCQAGTIFSSDYKSCITGNCPQGGASVSAAATAQASTFDDVVVVPSLRHHNIHPSSSSNGVGSSLCRSEGRFVNPDDCGSFFDCVKSNNGGFVAHSHSCYGNAFHPTLNTCVPPQMVQGCTPHSTRAFTVADPHLEHLCNNAENEFVCLDCKTLVICVNGEPYTEPCEYGSVCSVKRSFSGGVCYPDDPAECTCNKADIFRRDFYDPSKFLSCGVEGTDPVIHNCPSGLVYNEQKRACGTEIESTCSASGTFAVEEDCTRYFTCIYSTGGWVQKEFTCRNNTMYNDETGKCEDPCEWYTGQFTCEAEGRYANPADCKKYYECIADPMNSERFSWMEHECPDGFEWSQIVKRGVGHCVSSGTVKDRCVPKNPNKCVIPKEWCAAESVSCNSQITRGRSYFVNPDFPETYSSSSPCEVQLLPPENAVQIKLEFESLLLSAPVEGDCGNDSFVVIGGNPGSDLPILCGDNSGQHMYIDIDNYDEALFLRVQSSDYNSNAGAQERKWKILVSFLDEETAVPQRCLQYFSKTQGIIKSFNNVEDSDEAMALNNMDYSICFGYVTGYCNIDFYFNGMFGESTFDNGIAFSSKANGKGKKRKEGKEDKNSRCFGYGRDCWDDYIQIGPEKICGDLDNLFITGNSTGPMHLAIKTDDNNESDESGFYASYSMMPCTY